jgi:hypothetical protein
VNRVPTPLRACLASAAGILFALAAATPASAAPTPFSLNDIGEDLCTDFDTVGTADWPAIVVAPTVEFAGTGATTLVDDERPCLDVVPEPRHIEFLAYYDKELVDSRTLPFTVQESKFEYAFALNAAEDEQITHVTVAICITDGIIGQPEHDCTEPVRIDAG